MDPLVSFVVPCYKLAHLLPQCVNSILAQDFASFEVLIMDNCSPDRTPEVAASFADRRVRHIRNEVNLGHVRNFNKGITFANGKYIWLVSADDFLRNPSALRRFVHLMEQDPRIGYVFCRATGGEGSADTGVPISWTNCGSQDCVWKGATFLKRLIRLNRIVMSSVMVRKECYDRVSLFPVDLPYACDWYVWSAMALHCRVGYISEALVCWRVHEESLTSLFRRGNDPACITDELEVIWRLAQEAELAGVPTLRRVCNASIASRIARALESDSAADRLRASEIDAMLQSKVRDLKDEEDIRARIFVALGDRQFWSGDHTEAARSYFLGLKLRPWSMSTLAKYFLLRTGNPGVSVRRLLRNMS